MLKLIVSGLVFLLPMAIAGENAPVVLNAATGANAVVTPYRTFITIQRYNIENAGETKNPISNVRLAITFPNGNTMYLPEGGQFWPIGSGQVQEVNRTFEIPWTFIKADGFKFVVKIENKGNPFEPCLFDVVQLSEFNRSYTCHTDLGWQASKGIPQEKMNKEGVQIRVFTSKNSLPNEIPKDALALK